MIPFPYDNIREEQKKVIDDIDDAIHNKKNILIHAPTGLGKTAAALSPCIDYAVKNKKTVFFLTSRHTQHLIALETIGLLKGKYDKDVISADIVGKKLMCAFDNLKTLNNNEFSEHCIKLREKGLCSNYLKTKTNNQLSMQAKVLIEDAKKNNYSAKAIVALGKTHECCPYELSIEIAKKADVIIGDYYHIFNKHIQTLFFNKLNKSLEECIIIVDEAHNLPERLRKLGSAQLASSTINKAIKEANKNGYRETADSLIKIYDILNELVRNDEAVIDKNKFINEIEKYKHYMEIKMDLLNIGESVLDFQERSFILSVGKFLEHWEEELESITRIISREQSPFGDNINLSILCLDPSVISSHVINQAHSCIFMSATLEPMEMYKDLLGVENAVLKSYKSPFPEKNRSNMIIPITTTKYSMRSAKQFRSIAIVCSSLSDAVPGNVLIFFPSYYLQKEVGFMIENTSNKKIFYEAREMNKEEKEKLLNEFKANKENGSILLAVASGSFGEGIDLPGDFLKGVIIVGLPLVKKDLATQELIRHYQEKFGKGLRYGYTYPAFQKCLQNAGRCIRTENDKGVIIFLDERFAWPMYKECFPQEMNIKITKYPVQEIEDFFRNMGS